MSDAVLQILNAIGLKQAILNSMAEFADRVALRLRRIEQLPPVLGYEDFLIGRKHDPLVARILALNLLRLGGEGLEEIKAERKLASAINGVVKATEATPLVMSRRAKLVVDALGAGWPLSSLGKAFVSANIQEDAYSFQALLGQAVARDAPRREFLPTSERGLRQAKAFPEEPARTDAVKDQSDARVTALSIQRAL